MAVVREELEAEAEVYRGDAICREKSRQLLEHVGLPRGLLPLRDIVECGLVEETGFVWLKQKSKLNHYFPKVGRHVSYAQEISGYIDKCRICKLRGVKAKELLLWLPLTDISVQPSAQGQGERLLTCTTSSGLARSFPTSAFELE